MTGKELKAWADTVHDDAIIEVDSTHTYSSGWKAIAHDKIRAFLITSPARTMENVCNLDEVRT